MIKLGKFKIKSPTYDALIRMNPSIFQSNRQCFTYLRYLNMRYFEGYYSIGFRAIAIVVCV